jgi:hypothetical protein
VTMPNGRPVTDEYLVADSSFEPDGALLARDKGWGISLWRVKPPLVSAVRIDGLYPNDTWSGKTVTYVRRRCRRGKLFVSLSSDPSLFLTPQTIVARSGGNVVWRLRLDPEKHGLLTVPLEPQGRTGRCRVVFTVSPTAVPSRVLRGSTDQRELGAHFNNFLYVARP